MLSRLLLGCLVLTGSAATGQDGTVDTSFRSGLTLADPIQAIAVDDSGTVIVGTFLRAGAANREARLIRLLPDGSVDTTFSVRFPVGTSGGGVIRILPAPGGDLFVGGVFATANGREVNGLCRILSSGEVDPHFNSRLGAGSVVSALAYSFNGNIYVGGSFATIGGGSRYSLARLSPGGLLDASFDAGPGPLPPRYAPTGGFPGVVSAILPIEDGRFPESLYIAGTRYSNLSTFPDEGTLDLKDYSGSSEDGPAFVGNEDAYALEVMAAFPAGGFLLGGLFEAGNSLATDRIDLQRNLSHLAFRLYRPNEVPRDVPGSVEALLVDPSGRVIVGGVFSYIIRERPWFDGSTHNRPALCRLTEAMDLDPAFDSGAIAPGPSGRAGVYALAFAPDGKIYVAGEFASMGGHTSRNILRVHHTGGAPVMRQQPVSRTAHAGAMLQIEGRAMGVPPVAYQWQKDGVDVRDATNASLAFGRLRPEDAGTYQLRVTTTTGSVLSAPCDVRVLAVNAEPHMHEFFARGVDGGAGVIDVAADGSVLIPIDRTIARILPDGRRDPVWRTNPERLVSLDARQVVRDGAGGYWMAGTFNFTSISPQPTIVRLDPDGHYSHDPVVGFVMSYVARLYRQPGRGYLALGTLTGGDRGLIRFREDGTRDTAFAPDPRLADSEFSVDSAGGLHQYSINGGPVVRRFDADGAFLGETRLTGVTDINLQQLLVLPDGRYLICQANAQAVLRFGANGQRDTAFNCPVISHAFDGAYPNFSVERASVLRSGRILISGKFDTVDGVARNRVAVLNDDGSLDRSWDSGPTWTRPARAFASSGEPAAVVLANYAAGAFAVYAEIDRGAGRLANISTRGVAGYDDETMVAGFVTRGRTRVLVRGAGPALSPMGVTAPVENPTVRVLHVGQGIGQNDDWGASEAVTVRQVGDDVGAFAFADGSTDSALVITVPDGVSTAVVENATGRGRVVLAEVYHAGPREEGRLINISTRAATGTGEDVLIAGFVITGGSKSVLVRAVGPGLSAFGLDGLLGDPMLRVFEGGREIARADDVATDPDAILIRSVGAMAGAFPLAPASRDACWVGVLKSGAYTAHVTGSDGGSGIVLIEVYDLDP